MPYGGALSDADMAGSDRWGLSGIELQQRFGAYRKAGGRGLDATYLRQAELAHGVGSDTFGRLERGFLPGGGATLGSGDVKGYTETTIREGMRAGIDASRMPEFLERVATYNQALAEQGITIKAESLTQMLADLRSAGLQGMQGIHAAQRMQGFGQSLQKDLTNAIAPEGFVRALALREIAGKGGGAADWSKMAGNTEQMQGVLLSVMQRMPDVIRPFVASQILGVAPDKADRTAQRLLLGSTVPGLSPTESAERSRPGRATIAPAWTEPPMPDASLVPVDVIESRILKVRGHKVILDADLAELYGVETKRLNEQVRRNAERFPADFMFQLSDQEVADLRSHFATTRSWGGRRTHPLAFTEHGAIMAASVLNSERAVEVSILVVRAFVQMRQMIGMVSDLALRLEELEGRYDENFRVVFDALRQLMEPAPVTDRPRVGFRTKPPK